MSPSKIKKKKRLIISGDSPIKLNKIKYQISAPLEENKGLDMEQFEVKLFLQSSCYAHLDEAIKLYDTLVRKPHANDKFDIESEQGQQAWAQFLKSIQHLCTAMNISRADRSYIERFSKAYKILYKEDDTIYLPEIFDSAQEGYLHLWVNGEKYVFSEDVLKSGKELNEAFYTLKADLSYFDDHLKHKIESNEHFREVKSHLNKFLENFDRIWTTYEKNYILELMVIENDSRRYVQNAISAEKELSLIEGTPLDQTNSTEGKDTKLREATSHLLECIWKINSVANTNGQGRDDLNYEILEAVKKRKKEVDALNKDTELNQKTPFDQIHENIHVTLANIRILLSKYSENIEVVDPQLKNNSELVEAITDFENVWSKGKMYLLEDSKFWCFIVMSQYITHLVSDYPEFKSQVEWRDYEIFMTIPSLIRKLLTNSNS